MYSTKNGWGFFLSFKVRRIIEREGTHCALCYQHKRFEESVHIV